MVKNNTDQQELEMKETPQQFSNYLIKALSRPPKSKENSYLYRYTKIKYLINTINSGYMRLGSCDSMNDPFETAILKQHGLLNRLFYACFTKASESLAMYKLYGVDRDTVIFKISYADLERVITSNNAANDHEKYAPGHSFKVLQGNEETNRFVDGKLYCTAIGYVDPLEKTIRSGSKENNNIASPFMQLELAGKLKYNCWEYENEIRLCGEVMQNLQENECLAVKLPEEFVNMISVTLCPGFDREKNKDFLMTLRFNGILYSQSIYDPLYSDILGIKEEVALENI